MTTRGLLNLPIFLSVALLTHNGNTRVFPCGGSRDGAKFLFQHCVRGTMIEDGDKK